MVRQTSWDNLVERFNRLTAGVDSGTREGVVSEIEKFDERTSCHDLVKILRSVGHG